MPQRVCPDCATTTDGARCPQCGAITALPGGPEVAQLAGQVLEGRYELLELAGQGGMGTVYRALDRTLGRPVAVKLLGSATPGEAQLAQRFRQEGRMASRIIHPNVIVTFDAGVTAQGLMFLVMELLEGRELSREIRERHHLEPREALTLAMQIARAIQAAHAQGIVHRDLKPPNIFLAQSNDAEPVVKVMDFGLAKVLEGDAYVPRITQAGLVLGSPGYMSPEQVSGLPVDYRTDLYSLGVTIFEMLTGKRPFVGDTPSQVMVKHLTDAPRRLDGQLANTADAAVLQPLLDRLLAKAPEARPADAAEALALIQSTLAQLNRQEAQAPTTQPPGETTRPMRRIRPAPPPAEPASAVGGAMEDATTALKATPTPQGRPVDDGSVAVRGPTATARWWGAGAAVLALGVVLFAVRPWAAGTQEDAARNQPRQAPPDVQLRVQSEPPGATVLLAGAPLGTTPLAQRLPTRHNAAPLSVALAGFKPIQMDVTLDQDQLIKLLLVPLEKAPPPRKETTRKPRERPRTSDVNLLEEVP